MQHCPHCAELVQDDALICRFCRHRLNANYRPEYRDYVPGTVSRSRLAGIGLILVILLVGFVGNAIREQGNNVAADQVVETAAPPGPVVAPRPKPKSAPAPAEPIAEVSSSSRSMSFERCLKTIQQVATELEVAPINIVETTQVRMVRFNTNDGSVLVTCSAPDEKMVVTRSPHQG